MDAAIASAPESKNQWGIYNPNKNKVKQKKKEYENLA